MKKKKMSRSICA